jgi:gamma-glutamylcyclotransferase (GGCT)/AIG2-like uncharacterized protein YtfP
MPELLFVYGTLLPGLAPASMRAICDRLTHVSPATVRGSLYDLGPYPAVISGGSTLVRGELLEIDSDDTWRSLDRYEGCPRPGEGNGLFRRVRTVATLPSGESVDCWIYVYDRDLSRARAKLVECGCWRTYRGLL